MLDISLTAIFEKIFGDAKLKNCWK